MTAILAAATAILAKINSATPATISFTPTAACDFIVALVGYAHSDPLVWPKVTVDGQIMQVVASPYEIDEDRGAVMAFVLDVPVPIAGPVDVVVSCVPDYMDLSSLAVFATAGSGKLLGKIFPAMIGAHEAGELSGTVLLPGISAGSAAVVMGCTFYGNSLVAPDHSAGWTPAGSGSSSEIGLAQSAFGYWQDGMAAGDYALTISDPAIFFYMLCLGVEILDAGAVAPTSPVEITASALIDLGGIGGITVTAEFDAGGAELLLFAATRTNNNPTGPAGYTLAGEKVVFDPRFAVIHLDTETVVDIAFIANPPAGLMEIVATGQNGYFGYTTLGLLGLANLSGVVGVRGTLSSAGQGSVVELAGGQPGSRMIALVATIFPRAVQGANYGWSTVVYSEESPAISEWYFTAVGRADSNVLVLKGAAYSAISIIALEFQQRIDVVPTVTGSGAVAKLAPVISSDANNLHKLTPTGQDFHVYWETWEDIPNKAAHLMVPDDFYLARIPSICTDVLLSFAIPRCTWASPDDPLKPTTGLNFPTTARLLKATLDLLHTRNPGCKVWVAVQQNTPEMPHNEPYDPNGWWGMTPANVAAWGAFCAYIGAVGIIIDYECISANQDPDHHCIRDLVADTVACYTDADLLHAIKALRAGLPRPFQLILDGVHVGAYGVGPYRDARPNGPNSGYDFCLTQDAEALAALDGIHAMTYDAGSDYDPVTAIASFKHMFPGKQLWFGLRSGPFQYQSVKQTGDQMLNYCNTMIMMGLSGCHMYSGMWDVAYIGHNDPHGDIPTVNDGSPPYGNYRRTFPDGNVAAAIVAHAFNLGNDEVPPGMGLPPGTRNNELRLNNRPLLNGIIQT